MGKRSAAVEVLVGNMGSIRRETRPSMQREDQPTMATKLEHIAAKARCEPKLRFTSLGASHHARASAEESPADSEAIRGRRGWSECGGDEGELRGRDRAHARFHSPAR